MISRLLIDVYTSYVIRALRAFLLWSCLEHDDELPPLAASPAARVNEGAAGLDLVHGHHQVALGNVDTLGAGIRRHQNLENETQNKKTKTEQHLRPEKENEPTRYIVGKTQQTNEGN